MHLWLQALPQAPCPSLGKSWCKDEISPVWMATFLKTRTDHSTGKLSFHPNWIQNDQRPLGNSCNSHKDLTLQASSLSIPERSSAASQVTLGAAWCQYINKQRSAFWQGHSLAFCQKCCQAALTAHNWTLRSICPEVSQGKILQIKIIDVYVTHTQSALWSLTW